MHNMGRLYRNRRVLLQESDTDEERFEQNGRDIGLVTSVSRCECCHQLTHNEWKLYVWIGYKSHPMERNRAQLRRFA